MQPAPDSLGATAVQPGAGNLDAAVIQPEADNLDATAVRPVPGNLDATAVKPISGNLDATSMQPASDNLNTTGIQPVSGSLAEAAVQPAAGNLPSPGIQPAFNSTFAQGTQPVPLQPSTQDTPFLSESDNRLPSSPHPISDDSSLDSPMTTHQTSFDAQPARPAPAVPDILFYLNDAPLRLPPKKDGSCYYLMDLLQYSGIDLKNPRGVVKLSVNGFSSMFRQELKAGDQIRIEEEIT